MIIPIEALRALWHESERKMYPLATSAPMKYQQVILLARAVANELADTTTSDALAQRWQDRAALVQTVADRHGVPLGDLPEADVAGVAFVLRHNEIRAVEHQEAMICTIAAARDGGQPWVMLHERGNLQHGLMDPYQAIEMHLTTGLGLVTSVESNPVDGQANYVLTIIRMDRTTGAATDMDPRIVDAYELPTVSSYTASRTELRAFIEQS
jgi:hypothetical protein